MRDVQVAYDPKITGIHGQEACRTGGIGYFRVPKTLTFKTRRSVKPFFVKMSLVCIKM